MTAREKLLKRLSGEQFAAWEAGLFLDTHPHDEQALKTRREFVAAAEKTRKEYNEAYGMLTHNCPEQGDKWQWVCSPWPWDLD